VIALTTPMTFLFLIHLVVAIHCILALVLLRFGAVKMMNSAPVEVTARYFTLNNRYSIREIHGLLLTGVPMAFLGGSTMSFSRTWVIVGLMSYFLAAGHVEARLAPQLKKLPPLMRFLTAPLPAAEGVALQRSIDVVLALLGVGLIAMVVQF
jgi:hypothetical protein